MPTTAWDLRLRALTSFVQAECREPSSRADLPGEHRLSLWLDEQRKSARAGRLDEARIEVLRAAGLLREEESDNHHRAGAPWLKVASIAEFLEEEGRLPSLSSPTSAGEKRLAAWLNAQLSSRRADAATVAALREILAVAEPRQAPSSAQAPSLAQAPSSAKTPSLAPTP